jgi:hypothetical protein
MKTTRALPPLRLRTALLAGLLLAGSNPNALASTFAPGDFTTYGQVDWVDGNEDTPAAPVLLQANYNTIFASTAGVLEVGDPAGFTMEFFSASAMAAYLLDVGPIGALNADLFNPTSSSSGAFGGDVTALVLNIDFSDAGLLPQNVGIPFGDLVLQNLPGPHSKGPVLNGKTVREFSAIVNTVLGGGSYSTSTIADLDRIVDSLNSAFRGGADGLYAEENLALPSISLVIQTVSRAGNALTFTWNTTANERYQVQFTSSLTQTNWSSLGGIITATNTTMSASDTLTNAQMYYRIQLLP